MEDLSADDFTPKEMYDEYNSRYFRGILPDLPVFWDKFEGENQHTFGITWFEHKLAGGRPLRICLNPFYKEMSKIWAFTLLHEMVHVKFWEVPKSQQHGRKFQKEMKRLANVGAFNYLW